MKSPTTPAVLSFLHETFEYKIGDQVVDRGHGESWLLSLKLRRPKKYMPAIDLLACGVVTFRMIEECHGGVQLHYRVSKPANKGMQITETRFGYELMPFSVLVDFLFATRLQR